MIDPMQTYTRALPPMPTAELVECLECGRDFETEDPENEWCAPCTLAVWLDNQ
jgi:hypothetical protein